MGIGVIVHGYIECPGMGWQQEHRRIFHQNRRALDRLPKSDPDWPFFTRNMFSMLPLRTSLERRIPQYENQLIHFAGDYKNMYIIEEEWPAKFERLLSRLCWWSAVATVEFSGLRYEWSVDITQVADQYRKEPPIPPQEWAFRCFRFDSQAEPSKEAIAGKFQSKYHVS